MKTWIKVAWNREVPHEISLRGFTTIIPETDIGRALSAQLLVPLADTYLFTDPLILSHNQQIPSTKALVV